jgi:hypothetical protein
MLETLHTVKISETFRIDKEASCEGQKSVAYTKGIRSKRQDVASLSI